MSSRRRLLDDNLTEVLDGKGHLQLMAVPKQLPSREDALSRFRAVDEGFTLSRGFTQTATVAGTPMFLLSRRFEMKLLKWLAEPAESPTKPMQVDNSDLMQPGQRTLLSMLPPAEFFPKVKFLRKQIWIALMDMFGGGPSVEVLYEENLVLKPMRVVSSLDESTFRRFVFNDSRSLRDVKEYICDIFGVGSSDSRLHDFVSGRAYMRIDTEELLDQPLADRHISHDNLIYLDVRDSEGVFSINYELPPIVEEGDIFPEIFDTGFLHQTPNAEVRNQKKSPGTQAAEELKAAVTEKDIVKALEAARKAKLERKLILEGEERLIRLKLGKAEKSAELEALAKRAEEVLGAEHSLTAEAKAKAELFQETFRPAWMSY